MSLSKILPKTFKKFTHIYLPYLWHYATLDVDVDKDDGDDGDDVDANCEQRWFGKLQTRQLTFVCLRQIILPLKIRITKYWNKYKHKIQIQNTKYWNRNKHKIQIQNTGTSTNTKYKIHIQIQCTLASLTKIRIQMQNLDTKLVNAKNKCLY